MNQVPSPPWFLEARLRLQALAERFLVDDPARGLAARVPVRGGTFRHPRSGQAVQQLSVYAAGPDRVRVFEPRFLYSLPLVSLGGVESVEQLCARVAHQLGTQLGELGRCRDLLLSTGLPVDLEPEALILRGRVTLADLAVELACWQPPRLVVESIAGRGLYSLPLEQRSLVIGTDLPRFAGELQQLVQGLAAYRPEPAGPESDAAGEGEVLELTEALEEQPTAEPLASPAAPASAPEPEPRSPAAEPPLGPLAFSELLDKLGQDTRVSAFQGRLRFECNLKVVQGRYRFFLEQRGPRRLVGYLVTPAGTRAPVDFELDRVLDLKEVLDAYLSSA